jgi:hypothetical protein
MVPLYGGVDVIYFDSSISGEGYIQPLVNILFKEQTTMPMIIKQTALLEITNIVYVIPRRESREYNLPKYKMKIGTGEKFKEHYLVRFRPSRDDTHQARKDCLSAIVQYLNDCQAEQDLRSRRAPTKPYDVGCQQEDFDIPDERKEAWDHRMLDSDVGRLMERLVNPAPDRSFFKNAGNMADNFFSKPYGVFPCKAFGYMN